MNVISLGGMTHGDGPVSFGLLVGIGAAFAGEVIEVILAPGDPGTVICLTEVLDRLVTTLAAADPVARVEIAEEFAQVISTSSLGPVAQVWLAGLVATVVAIVSGDPASLVDLEEE